MPLRLDHRGLLLDYTMLPPIPVTRPSLPTLDELLPLLDDIWASRVLTNQGPKANALEAALAEYFGVEFLTLTSNCTLASIVGLRALGVTGEVVTSPFSFVATSNAIVYAGAEPVFADIDPNTFNLDPEAVARRITPRTSAILAVHSFGFPCDLAGLADVADAHDIPLVYDAAHTFGVRVGDRSLIDYGTCAAISFHATKVFNTFEGGAVVCHDADTHKRVRWLVNNGIVNERTVVDIGLNAKLSELHAAVGLALMPHMGAAIEARGRVVDRYLAALGDVEGLRIVRPASDVTLNHYMFPVLVEPPYPLSAEALRDRLRAHDVHARRYFFPAISDLPTYAHLPSADPATLPGARYCAENVLCLPLYPDLASADQDRIIDLIVQPTC